MKTCPTCYRQFPQDAVNVCPVDGAGLLAGDARVGQLVGQRYRLLGQLGRGAMGVVYRGYQIDVERPVAVKVLHAHLAASEEFRQRFHREASATARLSHPNIVSLFDSGLSDDGAPFLAMEYIDGIALDDSVSTRRPMRVDRALSIARQVALALAEAHDAGVVHRDLKLGNLMLSERVGLGDVVKVVDFGIAKLMDGTPGASLALTKAGALYGTPEYASPEQARGELVDPRSDIYSLGVVLYRLLAGRMPFEERGLAALVAHVGQTPEPVGSHSPAVPAAVQSVVARCMEKDPGARFQSAKELIAAIDELGARRLRSVPPWPTGPEPSDSAAQLKMMPALADESRRSYRHEPRAASGFWAGLGLIVCLMVGGWALFSALAPVEHGDRAHASVATRDTTHDRPMLSGATEVIGPTRAFVTATDSVSIRALVPATVDTNREQVIFVDSWDGMGYPSAATVRATVTGPGLVKEIELGLTTMAGRRRLDLRFPQVGRYRLKFVSGELDTELRVYIDVSGPDQS